MTRDAQIGTHTFSNIKTILILMSCAESAAVAGEFLHHGLPDQTPFGYPRTHLECNGSVSVPSSHSALPAVLSFAQSYTAGSHHWWPLQPRAGSLSNPSSASCHNWTLQVSVTYWKKGYLKSQNLNHADIFQDSSQFMYVLQCGVIFYRQSANLKQNGSNL